MSRTKHSILVAAIAAAIAGCGGEPQRHDDDNQRSMSITAGSLDGTSHPYVGLAVFFTAHGMPLWRCSGTMISSELFLTAGHCTSSVTADIDGDGKPETLAPARASIWLASDVAQVPGYPFAGQTATGTPHGNPQFTMDLFEKPQDFFTNTNKHDIGVVVLSQPIHLSRYGKVASKGTLDRLAAQRGAQAIWLQAVGYGLRKGFPSMQGDYKRRNAYSRVVNLKSNLTGGYQVQTSEAWHETPSLDGNAGGSCFGDSGGPVLLADTDTVVAVVSFGLSQTCTGVGFHYRTDTSESQDFLANYR